MYAIWLIWYLSFFLLAFLPCHDGFDVDNMQIDDNVGNPWDI